jgi:hypothetical protein
MKSKLIIIILIILVFNNCSKTKSTTVNISEFNEVPDTVLKTQNTSNDEIYEFTEEKEEEEEEEYIQLGSKEILNNELTGTVWIGQREIQTDEFSGITDIILTFFDESKVEIIEWEIIKRKSPWDKLGEIYNYKTFDGKNIIFYRHTDFNTYKRYRVKINNDAMILPEWFDGETVVFHERADLSGKEDKLIIKDSYYEDSKYYVVMEYKSITADDVHGLELYITEGEGSISYFLESGMAYGGYVRTIMSFPEDKVKEYEKEYMKKYGLSVSCVWARLYRNKDNKTFARSNMIKFK